MQSLPKVRQMISAKYYAIANQFIITTNDGEYKVTLDRDNWDYSRTTGKYRNEFLREGIADTRKKIKSGEYALADLNSNRV